MPSQAQTPTTLSRSLLLAGLTAVLLLSVVLPMSAQSPVPATANQAAKMPQFASRLHPASQPQSRPNAALSRPGSRNGGQGFPIYDNGPIDGNSYAWTINFGFVVSDSFTVGAAANVTGMTFGSWLFPGDVLESAEISITAQPNGGTSYFDQTVSFSQSGCTVNQLGYNVCTETGSSFASPTLQPGTYWVNLQNTNVNTGDPAYWDQNSGVGCTSPGCPSLASSSDVGTIPSESFTMLGSGHPLRPPASSRKGICKSSIASPSSKADIPNPASLSTGRGISTERTETGATTALGLLSNWLALQDGCLIRSSTFPVGTTEASPAA